MEKLPGTGDRTASVPLISWTCVCESVCVAEIVCGEECVTAKRVYVCVCVMAVEQRYISGTNQSRRLFVVATELL